MNTFGTPTLFCSGRWIRHTWILGFVLFGLMGWLFPSYSTAGSIRKDVKKLEQALRNNQHEDLQNTISSLKQRDPSTARNVLFKYARRQAKEWVKTQRKLLRSYRTTVAYLGRKHAISYKSRKSQDAMENEDLSKSEMKQKLDSVRNPPNLQKTSRLLKQKRQLKKTLKPLTKAIGEISSQKFTRNLLQKTASGPSLPSLMALIKIANLAGLPNLAVKSPNKSTIRTLLNILQSLRSRDEQLQQKVNRSSPHSSPSRSFLSLTRMTIADYLRNLESAIRTINQSNIINFLTDELQSGTVSRKKTVLPTISHQSSDVNRVLKTFFSKYETDNQFISSLANFMQEISTPEDYTGILLQAAKSQLPLFRVLSAQKLSDVSESKVSMTLTDLLDNYPENSRTYAAFQQTVQSLKYTGRRRAGQNRKSPPSFFEIPISSSRILFLIDRSLSMKEDFSMMGIKDKFPSFSGKSTKWNLVKHELIQTLKELSTSRGSSQNPYVNIQFFSDKVQKWKSSLQPLSSSQVQNLKNDLQNMNPRGTSNLYNAMKHAFEESSNSRHNQKTIETGPNTIVLVTDRIPKKGKWVYPPILRAQITSENRTKAYTIHVVALNNMMYFGNAWLKLLAHQNNGQFVDY